RGLRAVDVDPPRGSAALPPDRAGLLREPGEAAEFGGGEGGEVGLGVRLSHLLCGGGEVLPGGGHLDAELLEACAVEGQRLRPGVLRDAVGLSVEARLTPDALVELRLYLAAVHT